MDCSDRWRHGQEKLGCQIAQSGGEYPELQCLTKERRQAKTATDTTEETTGLRVYLIELVSQIKAQ